MNRNPGHTPLPNLGPLFGGDIRLQRIERVMKLVRQMTLAEMKALYSQIAQLHDAIVLLNNLILEKKLTLERMWMAEESAKKIAERVIEKAKQ